MAAKVRMIPIPILYISYTYFKSLVIKTVSHLKSCITFFCAVYSGSKLALLFVWLTWVNAECFLALEGWVTIALSSNWVKSRDSGCSTK